ncbi:hypothetical protein D3C73_1302810 [compost metagenome]
MTIVWSFVFNLHRSVNSCTTVTKCNAVDEEVVFVGQSTCEYTSQVLWVNSVVLIYQSVAEIVTNLNVADNANRKRLLCHVSLF